MPDHNDRHAARQGGQAARFLGDLHRTDSQTTLDRPTQDRLGFALRSLYDGLLSEPVPTKLTELVERLERNTRN